MNDLEFFMKDFMKDFCHTSKEREIYRKALLEIYNVALEIKNEKILKIIFKAMSPKMSGDEESQ